MGGQRAFQPGEYSHGGVGITPDWEIYVANYQIVAGHGASPPPHGYVGPDGTINLYLPNQGNLLAPGEALPRLPPALQSANTPAASASPSPQMPVNPLGVTQVAGSQAPVAGNENSFGGINPSSGNTLTGISQPNEPAGSTQANAEEPTGQERPPASRTPTLTGQGGRPFTSLTSQQAQALHEYIGEYHILQLSTAKVDALQHTAGSNNPQDYNSANQFHQQIQNRVNELERQIGNVDLIIRARTHNGHSNTHQRGSFQAEFQRLTGNTQPAPEGGFITDDGYIQTFSPPGE
jgi:hypothetical protein